MHFQGGSGLDHQAGLGSQALPNKLVVNSGSRQQGGDSQVVRVDLAIRQDENVVSLPYAGFSGFAKGGYGIFHPGSAFACWIDDAHRGGAEGAIGMVFDVTYTLKVTVGQYRLADFQAHVFTGIGQSKQVGPGPDQ